MITNILATIIIAVSTNIYAPKQHLETHHYLTYPAPVEEVWVDGPAYGGWQGLEPQERDNPNVRIIEVRKVTTLQFECAGRTWTCELSNELLSTKRRKRVVKTDETWVEE